MLMETPEFQKSTKISQKGFYTLMRWLFQHSNVSQKCNGNTIPAIICHRTWRTWSHEHFSE